MNPSPDLEVFQRIHSNSGVYYRVLQPLGRGGNSSVYLVEAMAGQHRGVLFALKLFSKVTDPVRLGRFKVEVDFLKKCDHPSIMRVYDDGEYAVSAGASRLIFPFVIADFLPKTLHQAMLSGLSMIEKLAFSLQLLSALAYLAERNPKVVHRDIKPYNIFVRGKACILGDFGLLKLLEPSSAGLVIGEPVASVGQAVVASVGQAVVASVGQAVVASVGQAVVASVGQAVVASVGQAAVANPDVDFILDSTGPRMARFYRTPDLVEYCKGRAELTVKSDVFQLGLVLAELFTGQNPHIPAVKNLFEEVKLNPLANFECSQKAGIQYLIQSMLLFDVSKRPNAADLLDSWEGLFREAVVISHQLEGRIF
ncbi:protein kinase domain-containing protein [Pedosphaera parvula]|nr:protein kinase [Pedosphaera parvula]